MVIGKSGGKIYIKPSHRGRFTELKKRTGHSATWFKKHGTAGYEPALEIPEYFLKSFPIIVDASVNASQHGLLRE